MLAIRSFCHDCRQNTNLDTKILYFPLEKSDYTGNINVQIIYKNVSLEN